MTIDHRLDPEFQHIRAAAAEVAPIRPVIAGCRFCGNSDCTIGYSGQPATLMFVLCPNCKSQGPSWSPDQLQASIEMWNRLSGLDLYGQEIQQVVESRPVYGLYNTKLQNYVRDNGGVGNISLFDSEANVNSYLIIPDFESHTLLLTLKKVTPR